MDKIKKLKLDKDISNKIHLYFDGDLDNITRERISLIYNDPEYKKELEITPEDVKKLKSIMKKNKDPKFRIILLEPTIVISKETKKKESDKLDTINYDDVDSRKIDKYILDSRKAYIDWINNEFYPLIIKNKDENLKIYQKFIKYYLALDTPYRGLLVFHGLGTGKTATAISSTEGLSTQMEITTLLPASLETEFINEVKRWGNEFFKLNDNNWIFYTKDEIISNKTLKEALYKKYYLKEEDIDKISTRVKNKTKINNKGLWLIDNDKDNIDNIKTINGFYIENGKQTDIKLNKGQILSDIEKQMIDIQITYLISLKYNFIHYNPFPKVKSTKLKEFLYQDSDEEFTKYDDERKTYNQSIVNKLAKKLEKNQKELNINSPFNNEVIIIDEVHNFVREIINKSEVAITFYNWIMNAKDVKLVFLSGTPIINKPSEISYLFNMLRGILKIYNFTIKTKIDNIIDIEEQLKALFYTNNSPIQQFNIVRQKGKIVISILQNNTSFESIMNPENNIIYSIKYNSYTFDTFIEKIYDTLHKVFDKDSITPSQKKLNSLSETEKNKIIRGNNYVFDKELDIIFNKYTTLFTIFEEDRTIDLSDTEQFVNYFFNEETNEVPSNKRTLLKRMISGLVSYYPIDRSSITNMPEIIPPNNTVYSDYSISEKINIIPCTMSLKQFEKYEINYISEKEKRIKNKKKLYNDNHDYNIRTRQACNMVYENDNFRKISQKNPDYKIKKEEEYTKLLNTNSLDKENIKLYSPKFYEILKNIDKFIDESGNSTGKILFYSQFRSDAGSEIFEQILNANGYSKYSPDTFDGSKAKRFTFITGQEKKEERKINREKYNEDDNIYGEYIQIMIISSSGAEGISLFGVRQVHILEPYWNYVRINQVFGRAIRLKSHIKLPPDKQNVEQYLYLSMFPNGTDILSVYKDLLELDTWQNIPDLSDMDDSEIPNHLLSNHKSVYSTIQKIIKTKLETRLETADENLFKKMEKKFNISNEITDIIKEASVDCIQNTRDNPILNENCLRYNEKLLSENSYFPGISANKLNDIDTKQLSATFSYFIKPDIMVIYGQERNDDIYVYYRIKNIQFKDDIRYIKDNSEIIGKIYPRLNIFVLFIKNNHRLNNQLGNKFSVFQEIYTLDTNIIDDMNKNSNKIFYDINILTNRSNLIGYKIKYNINETFYFSPNKPIIRLYPYDILFDNGFNVNGLTPFIINKTKSYKNL
tara:strand:+ start:200 stop:3850 length:3651 start_codon:yes stop_codon:yes gene_type:complete